MTREEKESEIEPSQPDVPVDHPPTQQGGQQNQPAVNLPQPNVQPEARRLQPLSEGQGRAEEDTNTIEETPTQSSSEAYTAESTRQVSSANSKMEENKSGVGTESVEAECDCRFLRFLGCAFTTLLILILILFGVSREYVDVEILITIMSITWLILTFVERGKFHSEVTDVLNDRFPRFSARYIEVPGSPRHASQFHRVDTDTHFVHEVADTLNPDEMPRMVYKYQETDVSSSDQQPESPNTVVAVDVHSHAAAPQSTGGACGYVLPEGRTRVYSSSDSGGEGPSRK